MKEPKLVAYIATYNNNSYEIFCWEGTTLGQVWNNQKYWYLPGSVVTIRDNRGKSKTFVKGLI